VRCSRTQELALTLRLVDRASHKLDVDAKVIQAGKFNTSSSDLERHELLERLLQKDDEADDRRDEIPSYV